ncbi:MAG: thiosulfate oxidation carrier protein SoxY, partial [Sulfurovaceae bacterium]|nr:thiosulfate oxidation carrier protein SoxY [Sulfurovaceae bacterium]
MNRRKFLGLGLAAAALVPAALNATDFRTEKPDMWKAEKMEDAIKAMYGDIKPTEKGITIKAPKLA